MTQRLIKILSLFLCFCLILEQGVFAQTINLSHYFARNSSQTTPQSDKFRPLHLRYISYDNQANDFKILLDKGDAVGNGRDRYLREETQELMKYFFIGLALPNEKFWVNLRPDSPDNILDPDLEKTDIGRIFLEADLQLKKDTSAMTSPQTKEGREYWDKLYKKAEELFGTENITIPTITRPWIVPNEIIIREAPDNAYIYKATLKVMLEEDYLKSSQLSAVSYQQYNFKDQRLKELNEYSTQLIKETIIPKLTYAVNTAKRYAPLRQVYYSLILAQWFKQKYGGLGSPRALGISAPVNSYIDLIDSGNLSNLISREPYDKQMYFHQYQKSFRDGEYNLQEPIYTPMGQSIRRYTSGGITVSSAMVVSSSIEAKDGSILKASYIIPGNIKVASPIQKGVLRELTIEEQKLFDKISAFVGILSKYGKGKDILVKLIIELGGNNIERVFVKSPYEFVSIFESILSIWDEAKFNLLIKRLKRAGMKDLYWLAENLKIIFSNLDILVKLSSKGEDLVMEYLFLSEYGFVKNMRSLYALKGIPKPDKIFEEINKNKAKGWKWAQLGIPDMGGKLQVYGNITRILGIERSIKKYHLETDMHDYDSNYVLTIKLPPVMDAYDSYQLIKAILDAGIIRLNDKEISLEYQATFGGRIGNGVANNIALSHWLSSSEIFPVVKDPFMYPGDRKGLLIPGGGVTSQCHPGYPERNGERFDFRGRVLTEKTFRHLDVDMAMLQYLVFGLGEFDKNKNSKAGKALQKFISGIFDLLYDFDKGRKEYAKLLIDKEGVEFSEERKCMLEYPFVDILDSKKAGSWWEEDGWERLYPLLKGLEGLLHIRNPEITQDAGQIFFERLNKIRKEYRVSVNKIIVEGLRKYGNNISSSSAVELIGKASNGLPSISATEDAKGGIDFNALPIQTESVVSSALGIFPAVTAFKGDLDAEWTQIQAVFNAGVRPSIQRLSEYTAAASASPLAEGKIDQARVMLADILRRDEESERSATTEESCKQLLMALEAG